MDASSEESVADLVFVADDAVHEAMAARKPPDFGELEHSDPVAMSQVAEGLARMMLQLPPPPTMSLTTDQQSKWELRSEVWTNFPPDTRLRLALLSAARLVPAGGLAVIWATLLGESETPDRQR